MQDDTDNFKDPYGYDAGPTQSAAANETFAVTKLATGYIVTIAAQWAVPAQHACANDGEVCLLLDRWLDAAQDAEQEAPDAAGPESSE